MTGLEANWRLNPCRSRAGEDSQSKQVAKSHSFTHSRRGQPPLARSTSRAVVGILCASSALSLATAMRSARPDRQEIRFLAASRKRTEGRSQLREKARRSHVYSRYACTNGMRKMPLRVPYRQRLSKHVHESDASGRGRQDSRRVRRERAPPELFLARRARSSKEHRVDRVAELDVRQVLNHWAQRAEDVGRDGTRGDKDDTAGASLARWRP